MGKKRKDVQAKVRLQYVSNPEWAFGEVERYLNDAKSLAGEGNYRGAYELCQKVLESCHEKGRMLGSNYSRALELQKVTVNGIRKTEVLEDLIKNEIILREKPWWVTEKCWQIYQSGLQFSLEQVKGDYLPPPNQSAFRNLIASEMARAYFRNVKGAKAEGLFQLDAKPIITKIFRDYLYNYKGFRSDVWKHYDELTRKHRTFSDGTDLSYLRAKVLARDKYRCQYCGDDNKDLLQLEHRVARSNKGTHDLNNLVTACWPCNIGKFRGTYDFNNKGRGFNLDMGKLTPVDMEEFMEFFNYRERFELLYKAGFRCENNKCRKGPRDNAKLGIFESHSRDTMFHVVCDSCVKT